MNPPVSCVLGFRAVLIFRYESPIGWLAPLLREYSPIVVLLMRYSVIRASGSDPAVKKGLYHNTVVTPSLPAVALI